MIYRFKKWMLTKLCIRWNIYPSPSTKYAFKVYASERAIVELKARVPEPIQHAPMPSRYIDAMQSDMKRHATHKIIDLLLEQNLIEFENIGDNIWDKNLQATLKVVIPND